MLRKIAFLLAFALLFANASAYLIERHLIQINVADDGTAKVNEKYFLVFRNATDLSNFRQKAVSNGPSLEVWSAFDRNITTHIDSIKGGTGRVIFEDKPNEKFVEIEYETREQFMLKKNETSRKIDWGINSDVFSSFESGAVYAIPGNVDISVVLPKNALLEADSIVPSAVVSENIVSWSGPTNVSGKIVLNYSMEKQIAPTISISKAMQEIVFGNSIPIIIVTLLVVSGLIYWKRKAVGKRIEQYVVEHSKIESKPGHEEEEIE